MYLVSISHENAVEFSQADCEAESDADNNHGTTRPLEAIVHFLNEPKSDLEPKWRPHERYHGVIVHEEVCADDVIQRLLSETGREAGYGQHL